MRYLLFLLVFLPALTLPSGTPARAAENPLRRGVEEYRRENYEEAFTFLRQAREQQPDASVVAYYLGLTWKQMGDYEAAARELESAVRLEPPVKDAYFDLAEVLYVLERYEEAGRWVAAVEQLGVKPGHAAFLRGLILARQGEGEEAIEAFRRSAEENPDLAQAAELQSAIIYARDRRISRARESLQAVVTVDPASQVASFAREYRDSLERAIAGHDAWRFDVGLAYQYDDNVLTKPSDTTGIPAVDNISDEGDSALVGTFAVNYTPLLEGRLFLNAQYNLYGAFHADLHSHDVINQSLSLIPGRYLEKGAATLPVTYSYLLLDGESYTGTLSVRPTLSLTAGEGHIVQLAAAYARRDFMEDVLDPEEDRDADIYSGLIGYAHPFEEGRGIVNLRYEYTWDDAKGDNWKNRAHRLNLSLLLPVRNRLSLTLSGDWLDQDYAEEHSVFVTEREDELLTGSAGLVATLNESLEASLQFTHTRADSNIPIYDYSRNVIAAGIEYSF